MDLKEPGPDSGKEGLLIPVDAEVRRLLSTFNNLSMFSIVVPSYDYLL